MKPHNWRFDFEFCKFCNSVNSVNLHLRLFFGTFNCNTVDGDEPSEKLSLSDVVDALEFVERWSLFDDDRDEARKYLYHMPKKLYKEYLQAKKRKKISDSFIKL